MITNKLTVPEALGACHLDGTFTPNEVYYQVKRARKVAPVLPDRREGIIVDCIGEESGSDDSPLTNRSNSSDQTHSSRSTTSTSSASRKTSHQASKFRVTAKVEKDKNDLMYKQALKEATLLVSSKGQESSRSIFFLNSMEHL